MLPRHRLRQIVNWLNLSTPLGLLIVLAGGCGGVRRAPDGLLIADGYRPPVPIGAAFTVGNVIVFRDIERHSGDLGLIVHEARHSTQYSWFLGVLMLVPYFGSVLFSMAVCGDHASYNPFERGAVLEDGNYVKRPPWWRRAPSTGA
ncbi:hypothetical protein [Actinocorallia longicatena]|uniref:DUF4157 domain-containing protein n=1 Tax=Actinocorallia longicatena TaxID=111803 RepID=A0ABP6Q671_9ACTN